MGGTIVRSTSDSIRSWAAPTLVAFVLVGCQPAEQATVPTTTPSSPAAPEAVDKAVGYKPRYYSLGIVGYNYTDTAIIDYIVDGKGAFNLGVSTETSGGGSTVCCFSWRPDARVPFPITVEWTRDRKRWCRKTVMLTEPGPATPTTLEVHFYPDRRIEVAVTDRYSPPRLRLRAGGADFRVLGDPNGEEAKSISLDEVAAECQNEDFLTTRNRTTPKTIDPKEKP